MTDSETKYAADMLRYYREAGPVAAYRLLGKLAEDDANGGARNDMHDRLRDALAALPVLH